MARKYLTNTRAAELLFADARAHLELIDQLIDEYNTAHSRHTMLNPKPL
jgi:hypothetical protein